MTQNIKKLLIAITFHASAACGDVESRASSAGDDGPNPPPPTGGTVAPEGLDLQFVPGRDMELMALTLQEGNAGAELLVAVRNPGPDFLCEIEVRAVFGTADDVELGQAIAVVNGPLYDASGVTNCLGTGEVGLGGARSEISLPSAELARVARIYYQFRGYVRSAATRITSVAIEGLTVGTTSGSARTVRGRVANRGGVSILAPDVQVYSLNDLGRPLAQGSATDTIELPVGATWDFQLSLRNPVDHYAAFLSYLEM